MDHITAFFEWEEQGFGGVGRGFEEVEEENGLQLSITEGEKRREEQSNHVLQILGGEVLERVAWDGLRPCESVGSACSGDGSWHCAYGKAHAEETNGGSSGQKGIGFALTLHGCE